MSREAVAILVSGVVLLAAAALWLALKRYAVEVDGPSFIAILFVPLVLYALVSGRLQEFSAPGGWSAKFQNAIAAPIDKSPIVQDAQQLSIVEKGGLEQLNGLAGQLNPRQPNALLLRVGRADYYVADVIIQYIQTLKAVGPATYVVFVYNRSGAFVGSATGDQILALLQNPQTSGQFIDELSSPRDEPFGQYAFLVRDHLASGDDKRTALATFDRSGATALVVLDGNGKPVGIVDRARLLTTLLGQLAAGTASD